MKTARSFLPMPIRATTIATESLKVKDVSPVPLNKAKQERIKYFKIYRWDPEQKQKPYLVRSETNGPCAATLIFQQ